jgi:rare lipoprotein A
LATARRRSPARSKNTANVVEDGEPVPKGGGRYSAGKPYNINGRIYVPGADPNYRVDGIASWYGPDFHGRLTANGEVYDMHAISAAHPTMPLPSYARVTNLDSGKSIVVRVNDRGPYARNRLIDLSIGTAKALDFYGRGLARVRVEYVGPAPIAGSDDRMLMATLREARPRRRPRRSWSRRPSRSFPAPPGPEIRRSRPSDPSRSAERRPGVLLARRPQARLPRSPGRRRDRWCGRLRRRSWNRGPNRPRRLSARQPRVLRPCAAKAARSA